MKLSDLLQDEWITVPITARDLTEALGALAGASHIGLEGDEWEAAFQAGNGEVIRVTDAIVLAAATTDAVGALSVTVGLSDRPFDVRTSGTEGTARVAVLVLTPSEPPTGGVQVAPTLTRILRESPRIRALLSEDAAVKPEVFTEALNAELHGRLLVEDALTPVRFRVYGDTPLASVVELMVRRSLERVPVVGDAHELLGIISAGDVLRELLPRWRSGGTPPPSSDTSLAARELMQRSVMCVSEDQSLLDAANLMVNRDVHELPVVREGVLVGFLERETVLKALFMP